MVSEVPFVAGSTPTLTELDYFSFSVSLATSHARLSLRSRVEDWDAASAVLLCEEALTASTGYSLLQVRNANTSLMRLSLLPILSVIATL